jgi:exopolysaccharide production protein ExoQ
MIIPVVESTLPLFLDATGKDVTLTGRTLLWRWADRIIADNPILGFGYEAFWIPGNSYAESIWLEQGMAWRSGLHFHNQWYEVAVELGLIGLVLAAIVFMIVFVSVFSWALRRPSPESCFFLGFLIFTTIRTYVEVDLFWQYSLAFMIFIASYCYAKRGKRERSMAVEFV